MTLDDMKRSLFQYFASDFSPDGEMNTQLRKTDLMNFAMFNEGNVFNKLIYMVDEKYKESCEAGGEYCSFHDKFLSVLSSLPSRSGYSEFSQLKAGERRSNAKMEWIASAVDDIIYDLGIHTKDAGGNSINSFLDKLENYNFPEYFQNATRDDDGDAVSPPSDDNSSDEPFDEADLLARAQRFHDLMTTYFNKPLSSGRKKRQVTGACYDVAYYTTPYTFAWSHDGAVLSYGLLNDEYYKIDRDSLDELEGWINDLDTVCSNDIPFIPVMNRELAKLKSFIEIKKYSYDNDDFRGRTESVNVCKKPSVNLTNNCLCECHKMDKVAIYNVYQSIKMLDEKLEIRRLGDVLKYYYHHTMERYYLSVNDPYTAPVNQSILSEINKFEKLVLQEISGVDPSISLTDYITLMSQPAKVWSDKYDFPRMLSLEDEAKNELYDFFNFDTSVDYRFKLKLKVPNFETISMSSLCNGNENFTNYCQILEKLPNLETTMHLMSLASNPLGFENENIKKLLR